MQRHLLRFFATALLLLFSPIPSRAGSPDPEPSKGPFPVSGSVGGVKLEQIASDLTAITAYGAAGNYAHDFQLVVFGAIALGFAVKVPMWPFHTWLPDAHTEAPTIGSVLLAGIMLKMGTYGFIRIALPVLPEGAKAFAPWIGLLAAIAIVYAALACLAQKDLKRLIAFS